MSAWASYDAITDRRCGISFCATLEANHRRVGGSAGRVVVFIAGVDDMFSLEKVRRLV